MNTVQEFALLDGKSVHASAVIRGILCDCMCPACGGKMIAKQGTERSHHFAHVSGIQCEFGVETALHLEAKRILEKYRRINLPNRLRTRPRSKIVEGSYLSYREVRVEHWFHDIIPDVIVESDSGDLLIEFFVTHRIGREKAAKIEEKQLHTVEIDLRSMDREFDQEQLEQLIIHELNGKRWIFPIEHPAIALPVEAPIKPTYQMYRPVFPEAEPLPPEKEAALYHAAPVVCRKCNRKTADWSNLDLQTMTCVCRTCCPPGHVRLEAEQT